MDNKNSITRPEIENKIYSMRGQDIILACEIALAIN
ncbi:hypothetical protein AP058_01578 [Flavobacterium sp. TAB 87]|nr:hypothetical protein AP058_01578 [Flavobacterium sp. TAB 87]